MLDCKEYFLLSTQDHPGGAISVEVGTSFDVVATILSMEEVAKKIVAMNGDPCFSVDSKKRNPAIVLLGERDLCSKVICFLHLSEGEVKKYISMYKFHPLTGILMRKFLDEHLFGFDECDFDVGKCGLLKGYSRGMNEYCNRLNRAVSEMRKEASTKGGALSRNFVRGAQQNFKSLKNLFNNLLSVRSKILVVRVDLLYRDAFGVEEFGSRKTYQQVNMDRVCFIDEAQKIYGDGLMGYAWKLEYGVSRGYHYHMVFFFDGARHRHDINIGIQIGMTWGRQTDWRGTFHNCNAQKNWYRVCGVGMFKHSDKDLEERFNVVAGYLTKPDYHGKLILPGKQRSFQTTFCKKKKEGRGRPRQINKA